jgi:hypothetical protein
MLHFSASLWRLRSLLSVFPHRHLCVFMLLNLLINGSLCLGPSLLCVFASLHLRSFSYWLLCVFTPVRHGFSGSLELRFSTSLLLYVFDPWSHNSFVSWILSVSVSQCPCISVSPHPCISASLRLCVPASLHLYVPASLPLCVPASLHLCVSASLPLCVPASLHLCVPASLPLCVPASLRLCVSASLRLCVSARNSKYPFTLQHPKHHIIHPFTVVENALFEISLFSKAQALQHTDRRFIFWVDRRRNAMLP